MKIVEITLDGHASALSVFIEQWARINAYQYIRSKKWIYPSNLHGEGIIFIGEGESAIWAAHLASRYESAATIIDPVDSSSKVDDNLLSIQYAHATVFTRKVLNCDWIKGWNRPVKKFVSIDNCLVDMISIINNIPFICFGDGE